MRTTITEAQPPQKVTPAAQAKSTGLSFGGIGMKKTAGKKEHPVLPDDGTAGEIARRCRDLREEIKTMEGQKKVEDATLLQHVYRWFWPTYHGKAEIPSSLHVNIPASAVGPAGRIMVLLTSKYRAVTSEKLEMAKQQIRTIVGEQNFEGLFKDAFTVSVDGDKIPVGIQQEFINELSALCEKFNCLEALEASQTLKPIAEFHILRHRVLTPEQNASLNDVFPLGASIKTSNV